MLTMPWYSNDEYPIERSPQMGLYELPSRKKSCRSSVSYPMFLGSSRIRGLCPEAFHPEFACDESDPGLDPDHCACVMCTGCPKSRCRLLLSLTHGVDLFEDTTPCLEVHRLSSDNPTIQAFGRRPKETLCPWRGA